MKTDKPQASLNTLLAAGANVSPRNEAHGLEGFGSGWDVRPESWCAGLSICNSKTILENQGNDYKDSSNCQRI